MGLLKKLGIPVLAGSLLFSSSYIAPKRPNELTNEKIIEFAMKTMEIVRPSRVEGWVDEKGKTKGVFLMWDFNNNGDYELISGYEFIPESIIGLGNLIFGEPRPYPSEVFINTGGINFDNSDGDIFLKRNWDGKYYREEIIDSKYKV